MHEKFRNRYYAIPYGSFALGLALLAIGLVNLTPGGVVGSPWMIIPGVIFIVTGIAIIASRSQTKAIVLTALKGHDEVTLDQLSSELDMSTNDVKDAIVDLRHEGKVNVRLDTTANKVIISQ
jgi:hypothetical protein